jgi:hypothetical protein
MLLPSVKMKVCFSDIDGTIMHDPMEVLVGSSLAVLHRDGGAFGVSLDLFLQCISPAHLQNDEVGEILVTPASASGRRVRMPFEPFVRWVSYHTHT